MGVVSTLTIGAKTSSDDFFVCVPSHARALLALFYARQQCILPDKDGHDMETRIFFRMERTSDA
jgi:hypothetical protein